MGTSIGPSHVLLTTGNRKCIAPYKCVYWDNEEWGDIRCIVREGKKVDPIFAQKHYIFQIACKSLFKLVKIVISVV